jgi:hypothetical protein
VKKLIQITLLILLGFSGQKVSASHGKGAEITYRALDSLKFEVTIFWYRECSSIGLSDSFPFSIRCGSNVVTTQANRVCIETITPFCNTATSACFPSNSRNTGYGAGTEKHIYKDTLDFTSSSLSAFASCSNRIILSSQLSARAYTTTLQSSSGLGIMYVESELDLTKAPLNSSPEFLSNLAFDVCCDQPLKICFGGTDTIDQDSLSYTFAPAKRGYTLTNTYASGFAYQQPISAYYPGSLSFPTTIPSSFPPVGIYLNPQTGDFIVFPINCQQSAVIVVEVTEWRKNTSGVYEIIGKVSREMLLNINSCTSNSPPMLVGQASQSICEVETLCFNISTRDDTNYGGLTQSSDTVMLDWDNSIAEANFKILRVY